MLRYIYNFIKYFIIDSDVDRDVNEKLNIKSFGIYSPYIYDKAVLVYPSILLEIKPSNSIEQFAEKAQRHNIDIIIHSITQVPNNLSSLEGMTDDFLASLDIADKIFDILEGTNGKLLPTFNKDTDKYFIHSLHRDGVTYVDIDGLNKITKTTFKAMVSDFSALKKYTTLEEPIDLETKITVKIN